MFGYSKAKIGARDRRDDRFGLAAARASSGEVDEETQPGLLGSLVD